ncbi:MAG: hypothetical protein DME46_02440 [Verrucomicrobia bacterium]|nr:MAG: hypothetical protein DME46_02440 [Verrucomicrobiota bacterium]
MTFFDGAADPRCPSSSRSVQGRFEEKLFTFEPQTIFIGMKDSVVRGRILQLLHERRDEGFLPFGAAEGAVRAPEGINNRDWLQALAQLAEYGLIDWKPIEDKSGMGLLGGFARMNEFGTHVLNSGTTSPIRITFDETRRTAVGGPKEIEMPGAEAQALRGAFEQIILAIEQASISEREKKETRSLLLKLLQSKAGARALGESAQSLITKYFAKL